jgi:glycosyltransferase involved in cell wall biosynthesis
VSLDARAISVVMPVRDGERYIAEAVESILAQTPRPGEIVVVDDGSTDNTARVLETFGSAIRVLSQPPRNQAVATNVGVAETSGELLAFLDADDVWTEASLSARLARLIEPDAPDGVYGRVEQFVSPEIPAPDRDRFRLDPNPPAVAMPSALLVRRSVFAGVGPLDEHLETGANLDWQSRARAAAARFVAIPDVVYRRRIHDHNVGITRRRDAHRDLIKVVRAHRARQANETTDRGPGTS